MVSNHLVIYLKFEEFISLIILADFFDLAMFGVSKIFVLNLEI